MGNVNVCMLEYYVCVRVNISVGSGVTKQCTVRSGH